MYKSIKMVGFGGLLACFFMLASVAHSTPIQLQYDDIQFPISVNFPSTPQSSRIPNPALLGTNVYLFVYKDVVSSLTFAVSITSIPSSSGSIPFETANMMVIEILNSQVANVDNALGVKGEVLNKASKIPKIYPSKTIEVWRQTNPPQFGRYTSFMVDKLLISVFASGLSKKKNQDAVRNFVESVVVNK